MLLGDSMSYSLEIPNIIANYSSAKAHSCSPLENAAYDGIDQAGDSLV